ncbi:hypothetical protein [Seonamhaeicola maritimus]|uniref:hypothetical protein n=1 Tax=Seonamhaeicola maritimus TaxID=2591822 RepID=UPI0024948E54|nr:hypothetical protein [Seonamhaeicola maritimus]
MKLTKSLIQFKPIYFLLFLITICSCSGGDSGNDEQATCTKTCPSGFILDPNSCECEPEPCTKTCESGFTLNTENCECECTKTCPTGFTLNTTNCECEEDFVANVIEIEAESVAVVEDWKERTTISEFSGDGYIIWEGPNQFWKGEANIGAAGRLTYKINIPRAGTYQFQWRSYIGKVDPSNPTTEHNDSWLRLPDADDFYGKRDASIVYPKGSGKTPNPSGENGNGFFKIYMNTGNAWTWTSGTFDNNFHSIYARFDEAKEYTVEIAARSDHHAIDKFKLIEQEPE